MSRKWAWIWLVWFLWGVAQNGAGQTRAECQECHADRELTVEEEAGRTRSLFVSDSLFDRSVHGDFECVDCHEDIQELPHEETVAKVNCGSCHEEEQAALGRSVHGDSLRARSPDAPGCKDCHGTHEVLPVGDRDSHVSKANQPHTCGRCHADPDVIARNNIPMIAPVALYEKSIHGRLTLQGSADAAVCSDCHGSHDIRTALDPQSSIFKGNIPQTCRKCHAEVYTQYSISVHAQALKMGAVDAPVCTDCHGEHDILRPENPEAPTSGFNVAVEVCSPCHESERLARKYGINPARVTSYKNSYHGLALRGGKVRVANCGSCHGVHDILPSSDPRSSIHPQNLQKTCGQCHPNPGENFARGPIHLVEEEREAAIVGIVRKIYIVFIVLVVGLMVVHNAVDFAAKSRRKRMETYYGA